MGILSRLPPGGPLSTGTEAEADSGVTAPAWRYTAAGQSARSSAESPPTQLLQAEQGQAQLVLLGVRRRGVSWPTSPHRAQ